MFVFRAQLTLVYQLRVHVYLFLKRNIIKRDVLRSSAERLKNSGILKMLGKPG